jgi:hypothetical protein
MCLCKRRTCATEENTHEGEEEALVCRSEQRKNWEVFLVNEWSCWRRKDPKSQMEKKRAIGLMFLERN